MATTSRVLHVYSPARLELLVEAVARAWRGLARLRLSRGRAAEELHTQEVLHEGAGALGGALEAFSSVALPLSLSEAAAVREEEWPSFFNRLGHEVVRASFTVELEVARAEQRLTPEWLVHAAPVTPRPPPWEALLAPALAGKNLTPELFPQVAPAPEEVDAGLREAVALLGAAALPGSLGHLLADFPDKRLRALLVYEVDGAIVRLGQLLRGEAGEEWPEVDSQFRHLRAHLVAASSPFKGEFLRMASRCVALAGPSLPLSEWARYTPLSPP